MQLLHHPVTGGRTRIGYNMMIYAIVPLILVRRSDTRCDDKVLLACARTYCSTLEGM